MEVDMEMEADMEMELIAKIQQTIQMIQHQCHQAIHQMAQMTVMDNHPTQLHHHPTQHSKIMQVILNQQVQMAIQSQQPHNLCNKTIRITQILLMVEI